MNSKRLGSIDAMRALTMYLMVFVNDLWTDLKIPAWLEHAPAQADAMGFADIIFPAFLFIVGLSIPFSHESRLGKGASRLSIFKHIVLRSVALLIMGFFQMNMEMYSRQALLPRAVWVIVVTVSFFIIWMDYSGKRRRQATWLQWTGVVLLIAMAVLYKGQSDEGIIWMQPHWWGILGLIGWAYFSCSTIALLARDNWAVLSLFLVFFLVFNVAVASDLTLVSQSPITWLRSLGLGNASNAFMVMTGVITAVMYRKFFTKPALWRMAMLTLAALLLMVGLSTRPMWGISKIRATPSWITITMAISMVWFALLIFWVDMKGRGRWFTIIKPAGTSTLTCYLVPYLYQAVFLTLIDVHLPLWIRTGWVGILKSLVYALLIVLITGWLEKRRLRLKI